MKKRTQIVLLTSFLMIIIVATLFIGIRTISMREAKQQALVDDCEKYEALSINVNKKYKEKFFIENIFEGKFDDMCTVLHEPSFVEITFPIKDNKFCNTLTFSDKYKKDTAMQAERKITKSMGHSTEMTKYGKMKTEWFETQPKHKNNIDNIKKGEKTSIVLNNEEIELEVVDNSNDEIVLMQTNQKLLTDPIRTSINKNISDETSWIDQFHFH